MKDGTLSCAFYVSSILTLFKLIGGIHGTVDATMEDIKKNGWKTIKNPRIGSILVWESVDFGNNNFHRHMGFYIGKNMAISNSTELGYPIKHNWKFDGTRKIETILWSSNLR